MTDLTVIEGGGTRGNPNSEMAEAAFRRFVASLIRAIAGKQSVPELHAQLEDFVEFTDHANLSEVDVMQAALVTLTAQAFAAESDSLGQLSLDRVTRACQTASNIDPRSASNIDPGWVGRPRSP